MLTKLQPRNAAGGEAPVPQLVVPHPGHDGGAVIVGGGGGGVVGSGGAGIMPPLPPSPTPGASPVLSDYLKDVEVISLDDHSPLPKESPPAELCE